MVRTDLKTLYASMDETCLVMIDRSMWFAKFFEALNARNFEPLIAENPSLLGRKEDFLEPVTYAFSYAQRVFLCSAMELCLLHHHLNSVALLIQRLPKRIDSLTNLAKFLKRKYKIKTLDEWVAQDWEVRFQQLREMSFSNLSAAAGFFDDIYGSGCFDRVWGQDTHRQVDSQYQKYQLLRNGILHRGGELNTGTMITSNGADIETAFHDSKLFRDAILALSRWCYDWWLINGRHSTAH